MEVEMKKKLDWDNFTAKQGFEIISRYLQYADSNYHLDLNSDAYIYELHEDESIYSEDNPSFLIIESRDFIADFNVWFKGSYEFNPETDDRWLEITMDRITENNEADDLLNKLTDNHYDFFDGNYDTCSECEKVFCDADSLGNLGNYWMGDGFRICHHCLNSNLDLAKDYLKDKEAINNYKWADCALSRDTMHKLGFSEVDHYYHHWEFGDSPEKILAKSRVEKPDNEFIFRITGRSMFSTDFELWEREKDEEN